MRFASLSSTVLAAAIALMVAGCSSVGGGSAKDAVTPSSGLAWAIARYARSASSTRPLRSARLASSKARCVAGLTGVS